MDDQLTIFSLNVMSLIKIDCLIGIISLLFLFFGILSTLILYIGKILLLISLSIALIIILYLIGDLASIALLGLFNIDLGSSLAYLFAIGFGIFSIYEIAKIGTEF